MINLRILEELFFFMFIYILKQQIFQHFHLCTPPPLGQSVRSFTGISSINSQPLRSSLLDPAPFYIWTPLLCPLQSEPPRCLICLFCSIPNHCIARRTFHFKGTQCRPHCLSFLENLLWTSIGRFQGFQPSPWIRDIRDSCGWVAFLDVAACRAVVYHSAVLQMNIRHKFHCVITLCVILN